MRWLFSIGTLLILALSYGIVISQYLPPVMPDELIQENAPGYYDYRGVTNTHTSLNKGSLPPEEVIREAQDARLDFLIFTDLNYFSEYPVKPDYHHNLLVLPARAYSYLDAHLVYYWLDEPPKFNGLGDVQVFFSDRFSSPGHEDEERDRDDFVVLAHPFKGGANWSGPYPKTLQGIETINLKSVWRLAWKDTKPSFFWSLLIYPFNSHLSLLRMFQHPKQEMDLWDQLNRSHPTIGFVGNETTGKTIPLGSLLYRFPSYKTSFEIASNHVLLRSELTGDVKSDRRKILTALMGGQFYLCLDYLENPKGFVTYIESGNSQLQMGARAAWKKGMTLVARLPHQPKVPFETIVFRDGQPVHRSHERVTRWPIEGPGVYRLVVRVIPTLPLPDGKKWIPWIYTNPFFIRNPS